MNEDVIDIGGDWLLFLWSDKAPYIMTIDNKQYRFDNIHELRTVNKMTKKVIDYLEQRSRDVV